MSDLKDKVALITGGSRRLGAHTARMLHQQGMRVVVHYRNSADDAEALRAELCEQRPKSVTLVRGDLTEVAKVKNLVQQCVNETGRLDVLINNASAFFPTPLKTASEEQWQLLMDTNIKAPFFLCQAAAPYLQRVSGCIINVTDIYAERPLSEHPIYVSSKAALTSLTRSLALDLGPDIRVNAVAPGAIMWPDKGVDDLSKQRMISGTPLKSIGSPDDIAKTIKFLIADSGFITGQTINVDGGRSIVSS
ncbi:MAG: pteridine reductase [Pseudomonadota bacterium]